MELAHDFTQKIRAAIKAKLEDLGAYDDNELPDYVVVMVANKKSEAQMTEDLNLFLGENTVKFTSWLHEFLNKLVSIATEPKEGGKQSEVVSRSSDEDNKKQISPTEDKPAKIPKPEKKAPEATAPPPPPDAKVVDAKSTTNKTTDVKSPHRTSSSHKAPTHKPSTHREDKRSTQDRKRSHRDRRQSPRHRDEDTSKRHKQARINVSSNTENVHHQRPHHRYTDDEEEDDRKKQVSSVVKVSKRRPPTRPDSQLLKAPRSLLLTAMKEAEMSVSRIRKSVADGTRSQEEAPKEAPKATNASPVDKIEDENVLAVDSESKPETVDEKGDGKKMGENGVEGGNEDDENVIDVSNPPLEEMMSPVAEVPPPTPVVVSDAFSIVGDKIKRRVLMRKSDNVKAPAPTATRFIVTINKHCDELLNKCEPAPKTTKHLSVNDLRNNLTSGKASEAVDEKEKAAGDNIVSTAASPHNNNIRTTQPFIINAHDDEDDDDLETSENEERVKHTVFAVDKKTLPKRRCRFWPQCTSDACPFHHPTTPCKNFPNCSFADKCFFIHPPCKFASNCRNVRCFYQHSSAPSQAPPPPPKVVPKPNAPTQCKFYPACKNMNCTFFHPKPCRFGISCSRKSSCLFKHPEVPSKHLLTWTASRKPQETSN